MADLSSERERLLQSYRKDFFLNQILKQTFLYAYLFQRSEAQIVSVFTALIPNSYTVEVLKDPSWDLSIGDGRPGVITYHTPGKRETKYFRFGNEEGIEPLVLVRDFDGMRPCHIELAEEFRLLFNLYYDRKTAMYLRIDENGDEEQVAAVEGDSIKVRLREIREFLTLKNMTLAVFFNIDEISKLELGELGLEETDSTFHQEDIIYRHWIQRLCLTEPETASKLIGKRLVRGLSDGRTILSPFETQKEYATFIIGLDEQGNEVSFTCDPDNLANYFGANPGAPHYLTPVFFRREVLGKYYARPDKYSVEDGYLRCGYLWGLRMDNNHPKFVVVFLGDLGRDLYHKEQLYWKSYNVAREGGISEVSWRRNFMAEFTDPQKPDLVFKQAFDCFQSRWEEKFGWPLFKPLSEADSHSLVALRIPLSSDQAEFDGQVLALSRVFVESLNEESIQAALPQKEVGAKGITKLEKFLQASGLTDYQASIKFLRDLHDLREGTAHRKGEKYKKAAARFCLDEKDLSHAFEDILREATMFLHYLDSRLLPDSGR